MSGLKEVAKTPEELRKDIALQEEARRILASGGPGHPPLGSEATGMSKTWMHVDRSKLVYEHELHGQLQVSANGAVSVNKAKVPTLLQWRETNFLHLAKLDGVMRENFVSLIMMYERLISAGYDFSTVYKFSLEAAEDCVKDPSAPFNADILTAQNGN